MSKTENRLEIDNDGTLVLLCALRYALGRHSYVPSSIAAYVRQHWYDEAMLPKRSMFVTDISEYLESCDSSDKDNYLEQQDNDNTWRPLLNWMRKHESTTIDSDD